MTVLTTAAAAAPGGSIIIHAAGLDLTMTAFVIAVFAGLAGLLRGAGGGTVTGSLRSGGRTQMSRALLLGLLGGGLRGLCFFSLGLGLRFLSGLRLRSILRTVQHFADGGSFSLSLRTGSGAALLFLFALLCAGGIQSGSLSSSLCAGSLTAGGFSRIHLGGLFSGSLGLHSVGCADSSRVTLGAGAFLSLTAGARGVLLLTLVLFMLSRSAGLFFSGAAFSLFAGGFFSSLLLAFFSGAGSLFSLAGSLFSCLTLGAGFVLSIAGRKFLLDLSVTGSFGSRILHENTAAAHFHLNGAGAARGVSLLDHGLFLAGNRNSAGLFRRLAAFLIRAL